MSSREKDKVKIRNEDVGKINSLISLISLIGSIGFVFVFQPKATFRSEINEEPIPSLALRMTNSVLSQSKNPFRCEATGVSPVLQSHGCYIFF